MGVVPCYLPVERAQIETSVVSHILELVDEADKNKDGKIDYNEWQVMGELPFCSNEESKKYSWGAY